MKRRMIVALTAGATLAVQGCGKEIPPEPVVQPTTLPVPPKTTNPPPMPSWDQVGSNHPWGATNPPSPQLVVDHQGRCFKRWTDPRMPDDPIIGTLCEGDCGTEIRCNEEGSTLYKAWRAKRQDRPQWKDVKSSHPEGATNPPRPVLIVDIQANCYKDWAGGMMAPTPATSDRVADCKAEQCGTLVECPERAYKMLKEYSNPLAY